MVLRDRATGDPLPGVSLRLLLGPRPGRPVRNQYEAGDVVVATTDDDGRAVFGIATGDVGRDASVAFDDGVQRGHILDGKSAHSLLIELFTKDGTGTMLTTRDEEKRYLDE